MPSDSSTHRTDIEQALADLVKLRQSSGPPKEFWPAFLGAAQRLTTADKLVLLTRKPGQGWRKVLEFPSDSAPSRMLTVFMTQLEEVANQAIQQGGGATALEAKPGHGSVNFVLTARIEVPPPDECVLVGLVSEVAEATAREAALRLRLAAGIPETYQTNLGARQAKVDVEKFASVLDLTAAVGSGQQFLSTGLAFCNGLATRYKCERVSLGWVENGFVKLRVISRMEKFDAAMATAKALETVMEETLDQDEEVVLPAPEGSTVSTRDHEKFAAEQKVTSMCSLPLRRGQDAIAVVTCERSGAPFSEIEVQQLRLSCDLAAPRLADLRDRDRWFGKRWAETVRTEWAWFLGPEHTWAKLAGLAVTILLAALFIIKVPYRVQGSFQLRSDELACLTAPFEGFIDQVYVRPGDSVPAGGPLLKLKTAELELDESYALADLDRYQREAEKARAARALAEMRVSEAMADQAKARLDLIRYRIAQATIKAPFAGVVVEGDQRERLGAPVKTADVLYKVANIGTMYAEAEINERDVQDILKTTDGQVAFVSEPKRKFPVHILGRDQAAIPKTEGNVFLVRCSLPSGVQPWWRPGMSGVAKFDAGKRNLFWILTHRTVDFLRLKLWW